MEKRNQARPAGPRAEDPYECADPQGRQADSGRGARQDGTRGDESQGQINPATAGRVTCPSRDGTDAVSAKYFEAEYA